MTAIVLGASADRAKFGNKAVRAFASTGWNTVPVNPREASVEGIKVVPDLASAPLNAEVLSIYLPPQVTLGLVFAIAAAGPKEVWLNPGADDPAVSAALRAEGLRVRELCSIIELGLSPADLP